MISLTYNKYYKLFTRYYHAYFIAFTSILFIGNSLLSYFTLKCFYIAVFSLFLVKQILLKAANTFYKDNYPFIRNTSNTLFNSITIFFISIISLLIPNPFITLSLAFLSTGFILIEKNNVLKYTKIVIIILPIIYYTADFQTFTLYIDNSSNNIGNFIFLIICTLQAIVYIIIYYLNQKKYSVELINKQRNNLLNTTRKLKETKSKYLSKKSEYQTNIKSVYYLKDLYKNINDIINNSHSSPSYKTIRLILKKLNEIFKVQASICYLFGLQGEQINRKYISEGNISVLKPNTLKSIINDCCFEKKANKYSFKTNFISYTSSSIRNINHKEIISMPIVFDDKVICLLLFFSNQSQNININDVNATIQYCLKPFILAIDDMDTYEIELNNEILSKVIK